jgi:hypothetical protein
VRGLMNNWHACSTVKRPIHAPSVVFSQRRYAMETPCSSVRKVGHVTVMQRTSEGKSSL